MKSRSKIEFGDFQTPASLAKDVVQVVAGRGVDPLSIVEPSCGVGNFLIAAANKFHQSTRAIALEINPEYFREANQRIVQHPLRQIIDLRRADFFTFDWPAVFAGLPEPILVIGNPPWVTASQLGALESKNLPRKSNFQKRQGLDALTGKSNFDIAEWMLICLLEALRHRDATVAMLLKTAVARKVLLHCWKTDLPLADAGLYIFNAKRHFDVNADACLLVCDLGNGLAKTECSVFHLDKPESQESKIAFENGWLLANNNAFDRLSHLQRHVESAPFYRWRSGVKHDCARVMELQSSGTGLLNALYEIVDIEPDFLYPMLKGSEVANGGKTKRNLMMIVPQQQTGQDTSQISTLAPRTWAYLCRHGKKLDRRKSTIYRNRPRFSIFGVGPYTFASWKVAICALYKKLDFTVVGPIDGRPVVLDDTCYHISCENQDEATLLGSILNSDLAREFFSAFVFWDCKRPITIEMLSRLDILALAEELGERQRLLTLRPDMLKLQTVQGRERQSVLF